MEKKNNKNIVLIILVALLISLIVFFSVFFGVRYRRATIFQNMNINFKENEFIEYGSDAKTEDFIEEYSGELIYVGKLDTMVVGKQEVEITIKEKGDIEKTFIKTFIVKDTNKPIIELEKENIQLKYKEAYNPEENIKRVYDEIDGDLEYDIIGAVNPRVPGEYKIKIVALDKHLNKEEKVFSIVVNENIITSVEEVEPTYINGILLVNKKYAIPSTFGGTNETAQKALLSLQEAAKENGYSMPLLSGYRSYSYQMNLYNGYVNKYGKELADTFSAHPGCSEHQTGLAFDVGNIDDNFGDTEEGIWLKENCAKFGFIIRYPQGKESVTGYKYEPWHIRYVGVEHATSITQQGITLEEYLGV